MGHRYATEIVKDLESQLQSVSKLVNELGHGAVNGERSGFVRPLSDLSNIVEKEIKAQRTDKSTIASLSDIHPNTLGRILRAPAHANPKLNTLCALLDTLGLKLYIGRVADDA